MVSTVHYLQKYEVGYKQLHEVRLTILKNYNQVVGKEITHFPASILLELLNNSIKSGPSISEDSTLFAKLKEVLGDDKAKSHDEQLRMDKFYLLVDLVHLIPKKGSTEKGGDTLLKGKH
jgi:hypothetical protein